MKTNRMCPSWDEIERGAMVLSEGQFKLLRYLDQYLPEGWRLFAQPYLGGICPDVVAFNPRVGLVIYAVKDWPLAACAWFPKNDTHTLQVPDGKGVTLVKNPLHQVDYFREKLIGQLVPAIGEAVDRDSRNLGLVKTAVYFHGEPTSFIKKHFAAHDHPARPIFGTDHLTPEHLAAIVPGVSYRKSQYWNEAWNAEILFWLQPPLHTLEQTVALKLTPKQRDHAEPQPGHFRLRGVAGSGKTQVLAYRAAKLAAAKKRVLILTFNMTLWHYIRDMIQRAPFEFDWQNLTFNHFHGFCSDTLNHWGVRWPYGDKETVFREDICCIVREIIRGKVYQKWDAVLIDEGQDYYWEWYDLLREFLTPHNELLLVCDKRQNIYGREMSWIDGQMKQVQFRGQWRELNTVFRLPKIVAAHTNDFCTRFGLSQEVQVDAVVENAQGDFLPHLFDPHIVWKEISDQAFLPALWETYERLRARDFSESDIAFLLPSHKIGLLAVEYFGRKGVGVNHVFEKPESDSRKAHKRAFWNGDRRLKMSTIHSFKGWECMNIALYIPSSPCASVEGLDRIVYTAMTRTRENLIVLNAHPRYQAFGKTLPQEWSGAAETRIVG